MARQKESGWWRKPLMRRTKGFASQPLKVRVASPMKRLMRSPMRICKRYYAYTYAESVSNPDDSFVENNAAK